MSIEKIEQELRENLDGVTKGPWRPGHLANDDHSCDCGFVFDCQDRMGSIATVNMDDGSQFGEEYPSRDEAKANLKHIVAAQPENIRALLDELSRLREAERALDDLQSWVRQSRIDLQPLDPDFHPKYETLKAIGVKIRAARALSTQVEERE